MPANATIVTNGPYQSAGEPSIIPAQTLQTTVTNAVNSYNTANGTNIPPAVMLSIVQSESSGVQNAINANGKPYGANTDYGLAQVNPTQNPNLLVNGKPLDPNQLLDNPTYNIQAACAILNNNIQAANGNVALGLVGYARGSTVMAQAAGGDYTNVPQGTKNEIAKIPPNTPGYGTNTTTAASTSSDGGNQTPLNHLVSPYNPVNLQSPSVDYTALFPDAIINTDLNNTPWYKDTGLITGNPKVRNSITPVVFEVLLHDRQDVYLPTSPAGATSSQNYAPLQVQLNASMKTFTVSSKHVTVPKRTRTGWHITMWGMQADVIEGNCTTGVFMNQFGLTDFFSTAYPSPDILQVLLSGLSLTNLGGTLVESSISPSGTLSTSTVNNIIATKTGIQNTQDAFRVAAQDAFVEFLYLFKMNGIRWFYNKINETATGTSGKLGSRDQVDIDAWSPELGITATQQNGRLNDVMSRGSVLMKFKGTTYMGYFKTLSWQQDAANPFQWTFNFVFQVEKTLGFVFNPSA